MKSTSSASVERIFIFASVALSPRRNRLSGKLFEKLVMLKINCVFQTWIAVDDTSVVRLKHKKRLCCFLCSLNFVPMCSEKYLNKWQVFNLLLDQTKFAPYYNIFDMFFQDEYMLNTVFFLLTFCVLEKKIQFKPWRVTGKFFLVN